MTFLQNVIEDFMRDVEEFIQYLLPRKKKTTLQIPYCPKKKNSLHEVNSDQSCSVHTDTQQVVLTSYLSYSTYCIGGFHFALESKIYILTF